MNITIEKNIPIPKREDGTISATLRKMEVGDSVVIPRGKDISWRSTARSIGMVVSGRKISATECRVWRVS